MRKITLVLFILINYASFAQVAYEQKIAIDDSFGIAGPNDTAVADINNDGFDDVIVAGSTKIGWFKNTNGTGNFSKCTIITNANSSYDNVVAGDMDGDNDIDIAFSFWGNNIEQFFWCKNLDGQGTFGTPILIINANSPMRNHIQVIDVDADNDLDILCSSSTFLTWFENTNGQGSLTGHIIAGSYTSSATSVTAFYAYNADSDARAEVALIVNGVLCCYKINANFTITNLDSITSSPFSDTISAADINNDGFADIVTSYSNGNSKKLQWFKNLTGAGSYGTAQNLVTLPTPTTSVGNDKRVLEIKDLDNDSKPDILHIDSNVQNVGWYKNLGNNTFALQQVIATNVKNVKDVMYLDANEDGRIDVLIASHDNSNLSWYNNTNGAGVFGTGNKISYLAAGPDKIDAGDIDNDGDLDLVASSGPVGWYRNTNGNFSEPQNFITEDIINASDATLGDMDNDGDLDVALFSWYQNNGDLSSIVWFENTNGLGSFTQQHLVVSNTEKIQAIRLVDIDHDNDLDIICGSNNNVISLYRNNGNGTFAAQSIFSTYTYNRYLLDMVVADFDNDNDPDVAVSFNNNEIAWYENSDGLGNLSTKHVIVATMHYPISIFAADLDGDNDKDLIFNNRFQNQVGYFKNNGLGAFGAATVIPIPGLLHPSIAFAQDVDNDGDQDLFFDNETGSKLSYMLNDGLSNFSSPYEVYTSNYNVSYNKNISSIVSADINADGKLDFALTEVTLNKVAWFKNLGLYQNKIKGTVKLDADVNGCTAADANVPNVLVTTQNGANTLATFTQPDGTYELIANQGNFNTSITSPIQNYSSNPVSQTTNFASVGQTETVDFCLQPTQLIDDLQVKIYPLQQPRPGFNTSYRIVVYNNGTNPLSGTVAFTYNNAKLNFISTSQAIQSQTANSLVFAFTNLIPFQSRNIDVVLQVKTIPNVSLGDALQFQAQLSGVGNDVHLYDNQFALHQTIIGAYDPNDINVLEGNEVLIDNADEYLHYIIRFQNTGNSFASRVRVSNILDSKLDFSTLQLETTSHAGKVEITNGNNVDFIFDAIYLPSSSHNFNASQGFICYKIKPKNNVAVGDIITNNANIYFDYNPEIATNTVQTQIVAALNVNDFTGVNDLVLFPNPVKNWLNISTSITKYKVEIYSQLGQLLYEVNDQGKIDFNGFNPGIYFVKIIDDNKNSVSKKIIKL
ncbi:T9SS type A sorting domain-containing protein [Flavobacterium humi]|uniref:T9SS type A sorting domain-containing protein n=1 Tax=Flavobacterium humi TaxID=2562683 RepID=A0A4Z0LCD4_9FLAO|nr:T9SS type A sorting domain-containing protein [Flavobacterium humi]TGD59541.1 T9SS type A sorting domain-containing protein [Flavobacterium humi]